MERGIGYNELIEQTIEQQYKEERVDLPPDQWKELIPENSIVLTDIIERDGCHVVYLVFVNMEDPTRLVRVPTRVCRTREIAEIVASYKCRLCSCDRCIPINVDVDDFGFSWN